MTVRIRVTAGGAPTAEHLAALASALTALVEAEDAAAPEPIPPVYRSRWRRAGIVEATEAPPHARDDAHAWGGRP